VPAFSDLSISRTLRDEITLLCRDAPWCQLPTTWPGDKVFQGLHHRDLAGSARYDHLTLERKPREKQRYVWIFADLVRLATFKIGEENEAKGIETFQQHGTNQWPTVSPGGGKAHRRRLESRKDGLCRVARDIGRSN